MTNLRAAAEMALEFLEHVDRFDPNGRYGLDEKIDALIQALAQPEQEPVHFLANGVRYKVTHQGYYGCSIVGLPENLNGQWVALVEATDSKHLNCIAHQESTKPEQQPVAWVKEGKVRVGFGRIEERKYVQFDQTLPVGTKLFAAPVSKSEQEPVEYDAPALYKAKAEREKAEKQEPVAKVVARISGVRAEIHPSLPVGTELYTAPPSKPWVSLTDEDIRLMCHNDEPEDWNDLRERQYWRVTYTHGAKAAQDELRSKNDPTSN